MIFENTKLTLCLLIYKHLLKSKRNYFNIKMIKAASEYQIHKINNFTGCPVTFTLEKIGGRWKTIIINNLQSGTKRYSELKKMMPAITEKMLIQNLKELQVDDLVHRKVISTIPAHVEYSLTEIGTDLTPILMAMYQWGLKHAQQKINSPTAYND